MNYEPFSEALINARNAELAVSEHFGGRSIGDQGVTDNGDVIVRSWWIDRWVDQVIEVKHLNRDFTCLEDFPFDNIVFENLNQWNNKNYNVWIYAVCNRDLTYMAQIDVMSTMEYWTVREQVKHKQGVHDCLQLPKQYALWSHINGTNRDFNSSRTNPRRPEYGTQRQLST